MPDLSHFKNRDLPATLKPGWRGRELAAIARQLSRALGADDEIATRQAAWAFRVNLTFFLRDLLKEELKCDWIRGKMLESIAPGRFVFEPPSVHVSGSVDWHPYLDVEPREWGREPFAADLHFADGLKDLRSYHIRFGDSGQEAHQVGEQVGSRWLTREHQRIMKAIAQDTIAWRFALRS